MLYFFSNYAWNCVVFRENLRSWPRFYTTAGRDSRDKSHLWLSWRIKHYSWQSRLLFVLSEVDSLISIKWDQLCLFTNIRTEISFDKGNLPIWSASKHVQSTESLTELLIWPHTCILIWQNTCIFFQNWGIRNSKYHKNLKDIHFVFYIVNQACSLLRLSSVRWWLMK